MEGHRASLRKFGSHLSKNYWETSEGFLLLHEELMYWELNVDLTKPIMDLYSNETYRNANGFEKCIGHIDSTVRGIARPSGYSVQEILYNGHKRKQLLMFQAICAPERLFLYCSGQMEGRHHEWTFHDVSNMDAMLKGRGLPRLMRVSCLGRQRIQHEMVFTAPVHERIIELQPVSNQKGNVSTLGHSYMEVEGGEGILEMCRFQAEAETPRETHLADYKAPVLLTNMRSCTYRYETSIYLDFDFSFWLCPCCRHFSYLRANLSFLLLSKLRSRLLTFSLTFEIMLHTLHVHERLLYSSSFGSHPNRAHSHLVLSTKPFLQFLVQVLYRLPSHFPWKQAYVVCFRSARFKQPLFWPSREMCTLSDAN